MYERIAQLLSYLSPDEAERVLERVFEEMIDPSKLSRKEREYLAQRRAELEEGIRRRRAA